MSLILHLETATTVCSVALSYEGKLISVKEENKGFTHAEHLTVFIEEVLLSVNKTFASLDAIAVSKGPGSYTGLRIGVATAKGLCYGLGKPLIGVNTLASIAVGANYKNNKISNVCAMLDARRMEVYTAIFDKKGNEIKATEALILDETSLAKELEMDEILFVGDGAKKFKEICSHPHAKFDLDFHPSAAHMIDIAYQKFQLKQYEDVAYFEPFYLKEFYSPVKKIKT
jgi:tRNA threonylcarbamoyladenosine biosynthesis protein TsaB